MPLGQVGLADAGVRGLAQQRRGEGVPAPDAVQHPPLQQLLDGPVEVERGDRGRPPVPLAQGDERIRRYRVADHGGGPQHGARLGG